MSVWKVLDSYALIAYLENEPGADTVAEYLKSARDHDKPLYMSVVNWGEVYYILTRVTNKETALEAMRTIETLPIEVIMADKEITLIAAEFKATHKMSYADCFAAALAKVKKAELITGDKEFKQVGSNIRVEWI